MTDLSPKNPIICALDTQEVDAAREIAEEVRPHVGSAKRPLDDGRLEAKFLEQVEPSIGPVPARELAGMCWQIQNEPDVGRAAPQIWGHA